MKKKEKSLKLNFIMNAILAMSTFIFPLITFPYVSRILLPEGYGKVSFATSIISYFIMFSQLGIPTYGIRACAKVRDNKQELTKTVQELFIINLIMSVISYAFFLVVLFTVPRLSRDKTLLLIISGAIWFNAIGMEWLYKALEQYSYITIRSIFFKLVALLAMFGFVHQKSDYMIYGAITILAGSASSILNFMNAHKFIKWNLLRHYNLRRHTNAVILFFAMSCATTIYTNLDTIMLGFMQTDRDVGFYNAAVKIKIILVSIVTSLGVVLLPRASYYFEHGEIEEFLRISKKAMNFVILFASPLLVYFMIYAREGILFLSGTAYLEAVIPMQIIMPTILFIGMTNIMGIQMLVPMGEEKYVLYSEIAGAVADLVTNIILIPKIAAVGAVIGALNAEIVVWMVQFTILKKTVHSVYREIHYVPVVGALILGSLCSIWVKLLHLGSFFSLLISSILFFGMYTVVLTITREPLVIEIEESFFRRITRRIRK